MSCVCIRKHNPCQIMKSSWGFIEQLGNSFLFLLCWKCTLCFLLLHLACGFYLSETHLIWQKWKYYEININTELDMSMACQCLKSPQSLSGTSAHSTMVTLVNIMVMNGWLTSFSFHANRPSHSWDKGISDFDLEISTPGSRSWVWSKGKVIQSAQYHVNSLCFLFTSITPTIPEVELFWNLTLKHPRSRSWLRSKVKVTYSTQYQTDAFPFRFTSIIPTIPEIWPK